MELCLPSRWRREIYVFCFDMRCGYEVGGREGKEQVIFCFGEFFGLNRLIVSVMCVN